METYLIRCRGFESLILVGEKLLKGVHLLCHQCVQLFFQTPSVCRVCVRERDRYWLMFLKFTWHLTGLVKSKQITLAPIKTEYSMHQIKMIIRVSHCSSSTIIVSGHNAGSTERGRVGEWQIWWRETNRDLLRRWTGKALQYEPLNNIITLFLTTSSVN